MRRLVTICAVCVTAACGAFQSAAWLRERNDDSDMLRLKAAYATCLAKLSQPAEDVVFPIENHPNGTVKSRLRARRAQLFLDTGFIWGEGIRVEEFGADGSLKSYLDADNCVVDRATRTGWVEGFARLVSGETTISGRGIYFSFNREFIKIFSQSEVRGKGMKTDPRSLL